MSYFGDLSFFILLSFCMIPVVICNLLGLKKTYIILLSSLFVIYFATKDHPLQLFYMAVYIGYEFLLLQGYLYLRSKRKVSHEFNFAILFSLMPLLVYKIGALFSFGFFGFLGVSYLTFKNLQIVCEVYDGLIKEIRLIDYLNLMLFFPTLSSGPIDRSRRFTKDLNNLLSPKQHLELIGTGIYKMTQGVLYKFVIADFIFRQMNKLLLNSLATEALYGFYYGIYLFFDFAGYSLLAIGAGYMMGIKVPENFNKPFLSVDMKDFWNRWHITLSSWFRDFLFTRLMMRFLKNKTFESKLTASSVGYIVNMLVMGLWHGLTIYYIIYGLYHGVLLVATEYYQKTAFYAKYKRKPVYKFISWLVTMFFVFVGFAIFSGELVRIKEG